MADAILQANTNTKGSGMVKGTSLDSGNILANGKAGIGARKLTTGLQEQATNPCNTPTGTVGGIFSATGGNNYVKGGQPSQGQPTATITNVTISTTGTLTTVTISATNTFVAGQTVVFSGLTTATSLNYLCGVVLAAGLSSSSFEATITGYTLVTAGSASDTGTATVSYSASTAGLSQKSNE
jgi:hypothetical protein